MPARTRAFLDTLQAEFASPKCQERQAQADQRRKASRSDQKVRSEK